MRELRAFAHSEGKGHRNDDFQIVYPILSTRILVLVGDFTSDSPKGANQILQQALATFVEKRLKTWREHLIPSEDILGLIARFLNRELQQSRDSGQTTLCACMVDSFDGELYFVNVGDSGFGIAHEGQFQFLRKGDVAGSRDASGFLPQKTESFPIAKTPFPSGARLLLFTDGFWENTAHFLSESQAESKLSQILAESSLNEMVSAFQQQILEPSNRRDDFTFIIVKEEPVAHKEGDSRQPSLEQLEALIQKKVFEAFDQQEPQKPVQPSPMEKEFLRLLGQTATGLQGIEKRVLTAVRDSNKKHHTRLSKELKESLDVYFQTLQQLRKDLEKTRTDLADQDFKYERRFEESEGLFGVQAIAPPVVNQASGSTGKLKTENRLIRKFIEDVDVQQLRQVDFGSLEPRLQALEKETGLLAEREKQARKDPLDEPPSGLQTASQNLKRFYKGNKWLWQAINSALLLLILSFLLFRSGRKPASNPVDAPQKVEKAPATSTTPARDAAKSFETLKNSSVDARQSFLLTWPQNLRPIQPPADLLAFMGLSAERAQEELICLANALAQAKAPILAASKAAKATPALMITLEGCTIAGQSEFPLAIRSKNSPENATVLIRWVNLFASGDGVFPPRGNIRSIWLQLHGKAKSIDGDFGNMSRDALEIVLQNRMRPDQLPAFAQAWEAWFVRGDMSDLPAELMAKTATFFNISDPKSVRNEIKEAGETLQLDQTYWRGKEVFIPKGTDTFTNSRKVLARNGEVTLLGKWLLDHGTDANTTQGPPYLVWLAERLGLGEADGSVAAIRKALDQIQNKQLKQVLQQTTQKANKWGKP